MEMKRGWRRRWRWRWKVEMVEMSGDERERKREGEMVEGAADSTRLDSIDCSRVCGWW